MRAPRCTVERGAALRNALREGIIEVCWRRESLNVNKYRERGGDNEYYCGRYLNAPEASLVFGTGGMFFFHISNNTILETMRNIPCARGVLGTMDERKDEAIAAAVQRGDFDSFRELVERYEPKMMRYARRFLFDSDDAKDLVQDVFIKAYVNIKSFDIDRRFSPWLYRIAHNEFVNALKKRTKERGNISLFEFDVFFPHLIAKETADNRTHQHELKAMLERSLDKIPEKYREPLTLYYFEELDYKEIADVLHIPVSTVGIRLQRGKAMLKKTVTE